jgi:hypothetical protein
VRYVPRGRFFGHLGTFRRLSLGRVGIFFIVVMAAATAATATAVVVVVSVAATAVVTAAVVLRCIRCDIVRAIF